MKAFLKCAAAAAVIASGSTLVLAQSTPSTKTTPSDSPSAAQKGAPDQGPGAQAPKTGVGSRPIGPPDSTTAAPGPNPTGKSIEKEKSEGNDPRSGGMKK